jgi:predicted ATPase
MLLLVDNLEQVVDAAPSLADVLSQCPNLRLLVTSRVLMRITAEREYHVPPLPADDAVALFKERAAVSEPIGVVEEICRRVDGLPLAVELAAARTRVLPPDRLLARLEKRLPLLTGGARDAPARQRTLRATIEWSYDLLSEDEKKLFARLAAFSGSFTAEAVEEVCEAELDTLQALVEHSLVRRWASGRLGMLETIREYALEKFQESGEAQELQRRQAMFLLRVAESAHLSVDEVESGGQRYDLIAAELDNIRGSLDWSLATAEIELGLSLATAIGQFWITAPFEGQRWFASLVERAENIAPELHARALRDYGGCADRSGDWDLAERLYTQSLGEFRGLGDEWGVAHLLHRLAIAATGQRDHERARELVEQSREIYRRFGSRFGEAEALDLLAYLAWQEGDRASAFELYLQCAAIMRDIGFGWFLEGVLLNLVEVAIETGRKGQMEDWRREALEIGREIGDRRGSVYGLALSARIAAERGDLQRAGLLWGAVEAEEARGQIGQWEDEREKYAAHILAHAGPDLERGLEEGRLLSLAEAIERALSD